MLEYDRIDISEGIDVGRKNKSKERKICHYWYFVKVVMVYYKNLLVLIILLSLMLKEVLTELFFGI